MRNRVTLSFVAVVALAATTALAAPPPLSCGVSTPWQQGQQGLWTVTASGPTTNGGRTEITYTVKPLTAQQPDHIGVLALDGPSLAVAGTTGYQIAAACVGDSLTGLGKLACHERAIRVNPAPSQTTFIVSQSGERKLVTTSFVVRNNKYLSACVIAGLGEEQGTTSGSCVENCGGFHPFQSVRKIETFKFKGCEVTFEFNTETGAVVDFFAQPVSNAPSTTVCEATEGLITDLIVDGGSIRIGQEQVQFGDGWINSGTGSCSTRLIGGRYYTTCY